MISSFNVYDVHMYNTLASVPGPLFFRTINSHMTFVTYDLWSYMRGWREGLKPGYNTLQYIH